jgi:hypothetical protein
MILLHVQVLCGAPATPCAAFLPDYQYYMLVLPATLSFITCMSADAVVYRLLHRCCWWWQAVLYASLPSTLLIPPIALSAYCLCRYCGLPPAAPGAAGGGKQYYMLLLPSTLLIPPVALSAYCLCRYAVVYRLLHQVLVVVAV